MLCLDTDIIVSFLRADKEAVAFVDRLSSTSEEIAVTAITLCELYRGVFLSRKQEESLTFLNRFVARFTLLDHSRFSCIIFGQDAAFLSRKGTPTQEMDLMIASICKANRCTLVTRNLRDFRSIPNLSIEKW